MISSRPSRTRDTPSEDVRAIRRPMPIAASGLVDESIRTSLEARLQLAGEVNAMWAYGKPGLAVCLVQGNEGWRIFVGAEREDSLAEVDALGVELEIYE